MDIRFIIRDMLQRVYVRTEILWAGINEEINVTVYIKSFIVITFEYSWTQESDWEAMAIAELPI